MTAFLIIAPCTPPLCWDLLESPHHISHLQTHTFKDYVAIIVPFPKKKKAFVLGAGSVLVLINLWNLVLSLNYKNVAFPKARR